MSFLNDDLPTTLLTWTQHKYARPWSDALGLVPPRADGATAWVQYPIKVTRRFREGLLAALPALQYHPHALLFRKLLQYLLYARLRDRDTGRLVLPAEAVARMAKKKVGENGFRAIDFLEAFSRDVFALDVSGWVPGQRARTVDFALPEAVTALQDDADLSAPDADMVWLVSGLPVTPGGRRKAAARYDELTMPRIYRR